MLRTGMVAAEKRWTKRVSSSRLRKWPVMRARERVWREDGAGKDVGEGDA